MARAAGTTHGHADSRQTRQSTLSFGGSEVSAGAALRLNALPGLAYGTHPQAPLPVGYGLPHVVYAVHRAALDGNLRQHG